MSIILDFGFQICPEFIESSPYSDLLVLYSITLTLTHTFNTYTTCTHGIFFIPGINVFRHTYIRVSRVARSSLRADRIETLVGTLPIFSEKHTICVRIFGNFPNLFASEWYFRMQFFQMLLRALKIPNYIFSEASDCCHAVSTVPLRGRSDGTCLQKNISEWDKNFRIWKFPNDNFSDSEISEWQFLGF